MGEEEGQELFHDIFGSVLDRTELTPYLLRGCPDYEAALRGASLMMGNRGFRLEQGEPAPGELERASAYVRQALSWILSSFIPDLRSSLQPLLSIDSPRTLLYRETLSRLSELRALFASGPFREAAERDPRNLFLLASSAKYPDLFRGDSGFPESIPPRWRFAACSLLKASHLVKSLEEDSQDIRNFAVLGFFFREKNIPLSRLFGHDWTSASSVPADEGARCAYVQCASFFAKLGASVTREKDGSLFFNSGDGVRVELVDIKARLKSPASMFAKLGKDESGESWSIRDVVAVTFLLKRRDDSLTLFHALQKQGVILQENTASASITQTLYDSPEDMEKAVQGLMDALAIREGVRTGASADSVRRNAVSFYRSLTTDRGLNPHSSDSHRKIQCKLHFSVPVVHAAESGHVLVSGDDFPPAAGTAVYTSQHTLPVELRLSDLESWEKSELRGESHHEAYKCRQYLQILQRLFSPLAGFPSDQMKGLREDQSRLYC
ncbi:hypothetical protein K7J14_03600 [Treponema zuelzerae]|uniref:Uncharacterized protein n=1 Tax=Teretinema zuelzerae TaxID=156 RepID=A0AAE3EHH8_9SPIR|nr:hypothetical protein [Teretinema zuelzerae]MCD1653783.1 hypothetical protein [Teretinema zuelzerae]